MADFEPWLDELNSAARRRGFGHGTLALVRATFAGFLALPAPSGEEWWHVLGVDQGATYEQIRDAYRRLAREHHPDRGGDAATMAQINEAFSRATER